MVSCFRAYVNARLGGLRSNSYTAKGTLPTFPKAGKVPKTISGIRRRTTGGAYNFLRFLVGGISRTGGRLLFLPEPDGRTADDHHKDHRNRCHTGGTGLCRCLGGFFRLLGGFFAGNAADGVTGLGAEGSQAQFRCLEDEVERFIFLTSSYMDSVPKELEEAAVIDGCGVYRTLLIIVLPMMKASIATVSIMTYLNNWNEFVMAMTFLSSPD